MSDDVAFKYLVGCIFVVSMCPMNGLRQMINPHETFGRGDIPSHTYEKIQEKWCMVQHVKK